MKLAGVVREAFGTTDNGDAVEAIRLVNARGMSVCIISYGASIQSVCVADRSGAFADVTIGHATLGGYIDHPQYSGSTIGRVANRLAGARFTLDGRDYKVTANDGPNSLHGGSHGFDKVNWTVVGSASDARQSVTLQHVSPDGDQGYPGTLTVTATYALDEDNALSVVYSATTDAPTIINLSNHAYWNLAGEGSADSAMDHHLTIHADHYLPVDADLIPTGECRPVDDSVFDFRNPDVIGSRVRDATDEQIGHGRGYDHNWVIGNDVTRQPRLVACLEDTRSGRTMTIHSNQPGIQFYSGNFFDGRIAGKAGKFYRMGDAIALEPQQFPDAPNQPSFNSIRLDPGNVYSNIIIWRFGAAKIEARP